MTNHRQWLKDMADEVREAASRLTDDERQSLQRILAWWEHECDQSDRHKKLN